MQKIYLTIIFILFIILKSFSQTASDFTLMSTDGRLFNLYSQLDSGKIVLLDFFSVGCPSCQDNTPFLDSVWNEYGYNGDSLWLWGIESYYADSAEIEAFRHDYGASFPCFSTKDDTTVLGLYNITYTPQYYITCPITHSAKKISKESIISYVENCKQNITSSNVENIMSRKYLIFWGEGGIVMENDEQEPLFAEIYDMSGRLFYKTKVEKTKKVPFDLLEKGNLYLLRVTYTKLKFSHTLKFIAL